jgi:hypothetical protein
MPIGSSIFAEADVGPIAASSGAGIDLSSSGFGPMSSTSNVHPLHPGTGFGGSFWIGVGALVALAWVRHNLPA